MEEPASNEKVEASVALKVALFLSCLGVLLLFFYPRFIMDLAGIAKMLGL